MALDPEHVAAVQEDLVAWYARHARTLPWRQTRDPYAILVAEVMLQQTQVERVIPKWQAWLARFPTLQDLAAASRRDVIREWQGLGYNLRAVRLHEIALQVVTEHDGQLPRSLDGLLRLKGIGRYTAGAVACFAYELPVSMVDTNVRRVLARVFSVDATDRSRFQAVADALVPQSAAYAWNQALMDLGATVCRPERPLCLVCPLLQRCVAQRTGARVQARAASQGVFEGSNRFVRGRIVDALRALPPGHWLRIGVAAEQLGVDPERFERIVQRLADDGLAIVNADGEAKLPD